MIESILKVVQGWVKIKGNSDGTFIGNVNDRLKVTSDTLAYSNKLQYIDMNATTGGVARSTSVSTSFVNLYSYTGSGYLFGFMVNLEDGANPWKIQLLIDGVDVLDSIRTDDLKDAGIYNVNGDSHLDFGNDGNLFTFDFSKQPFLYNSSVVVKARRVTTKKRFFAGLIKIYKN